MENPQYKVGDIVLVFRSGHQLLNRPYFVQIEAVEYVDEHGARYTVDGGSGSVHSGNIISVDELDALLQEHLR